VSREKRRLVQRSLNLASAAATWRLAWHPTQRAFDEALADAAWTLLPYIDVHNGGIVVSLPRQAEQILPLDHFDVIYFVVRNGRGETVAGDADFPPLEAPEAINELRAYDAKVRCDTMRA
jgi:two-component system sensor histidine kinase TctE